ncbi:MULTISPECIES: transaldolase [Rhodococcus]|uniref:Transaldolase n=1 Tax=Rhodococcus opacus TaxID=37919 RepID=A0A076EYU8_RHOOP|nr:MULTISPECIES: transaldolase [Rhodococcus]AII10598.1 transaldolase [Rhodococcus opacus]WAM19842.1 transaldolase [Rhodococcus sp. JS3073]
MRNDRGRTVRPHEYLDTDEGPAWEEHNPAESPAASGPLQRLSAAGVAVWLDDLSRHRLASGSLDALVRNRSVSGVTTNPSIFENALRSGEAAYGEQIVDLAVAGANAAEAVRALTTTDVRWACEILQETYERSGGADGYVSIEVDPYLSRNVPGTVAEARDLFRSIGRRNVLIKIPATAECLPAITQTLAAGIGVNVTLIFSLERYEGVQDAFMAGLEQARANGHDLSHIQSVASFFISRVDTEVDRRLGEDTRDYLRGAAAIANARLAYEKFETMLRTPRWRALEADGAHPQRLLWASTGVKNPAYFDTRYVTELIAARTVNTMPEETLHAVAEHGVVDGDSISGAYDTSRTVLDKLTLAGVDYDDVVRALEAEGLQKFEVAWNELTSTVALLLDDARAQIDRSRNTAQKPPPFPVTAVQAREV